MRSPGTRMHLNIFRSEGFLLIPARLPVQARQSAVIDDTFIVLVAKIHFCTYNQFWIKNGEAGFIIRGYSSAGRTLAWHARGRRFESD